MSVVIPAYNSAEFLAETLDSALSQTYQNVEVIVVDDGSTDSTGALLATYRRAVRVLSQPNRGVSAARNVGVSAAKGDLIAFLDSDDLWAPDKLERQVALFLSEPTLGVCFTNYTFFGEPTPYKIGFEERGWNIVYLPRRHIGPDAYLISPPLVEAFLFQETNACWTSTVILRRRCLETTGFFNEAYRVPSHEDWHLWIRLAKHFPFAYIDRALARRRVRTARFASRKEELERRSIHDTIEMLESLHRWISLSPQEHRAVRRRLATYYFAAGYLDFSNGHLGAARRHLAGSLRLSVSTKTVAYYVATFPPGVVIRMLRGIKRTLASPRLGVRAWLSAYRRHQR